jgi:hypothetical protein
VPVRRALAVALALLIGAPALANPPPRPADKGHKGSGDDDDDDDDDAKKPAPAKGSATTGDDDDDDDDDTGKPKAAAAPAPKPAPELQKQDLTGHDLGTNKQTAAGEKDRFFVDKVDSDKTRDGTLVQGSLTLSTFFYGEGGGAFGNAGMATAVGNNTTAPSVYWGDLRLQTDFRHIGGGRWDARVDFRARFVDTPANDVVGPNAGAYDQGSTGVTTELNRVQSGLLGENEYDLRELWLIRNGDRTDLIFGRQFIPDLGAVKIDGLRVDYASSQRFTYLGFAGLYPLRGSRSLSSDYADSINPVTGEDDGRFTGAAGFGGAYRTQQAYGSIGGVALVPFEHEDPRVFATSTGYWRVNPVLDFYHFALVDVVSSYGAQLTNLSAGINYKPTPRLRLTASFNRTDTDTLNIQAAQFFTNPNAAGLPAGGLVLNEIYVSRIATNEARASVSAALGADERFQLTAAATYRERPNFTLDFTIAPTDTTGASPSIHIDEAQSVEIYGSFTDRHSFKDLRLGIDGLDSFGIGGTPYERAKVYSARVFASRDFANGKGEWEAELSYTGATDANGAGTTCTSLMNVASCFGASSDTVLSLGGSLYYRIGPSWFVLGTLYLQRTSISANIGGTQVDDAPIDGLTGFFRIAYRF